jgi:hypothetical protein
VRACDLPVAAAPPSVAARQPLVEARRIITVDACRNLDPVLLTHLQHVWRVDEQREPADERFVQRLCCRVGHRVHRCPDPFDLCRKSHDLPAANNLQPLALKLRDGTVELIDQDKLLIPHRDRTGNVLDNSLFKLLDVGVTEHILKHRLGCVVYEEPLTQRFCDSVGEMRLGTPVVAHKQQRVACQQ